MNKLTADKARHALAMLRVGAEQQVLSIKSEYMLQALEIALTVLEREEGFTELSEISPYDVQHTMPESLVGLISEEIGITFDEDDAQAIWNVCRLEMMKARQPSTTPQIDNDGWIEWGGGNCPVNRSCWVEAKLRNGKEDAGWGWIAEWRHTGNGYDIIAYRVIENDGREG